MLSAGDTVANRKSVVKGHTVIPATISQCFQLEESVKKQWLLIVDQLIAPQCTLSDVHRHLYLQQPAGSDRTAELGHLNLLHNSASSLSLSRGLIGLKMKTPVWFAAPLIIFTSSTKKHIP